MNGPYLLGVAAAVVAAVFVVIGLLTMNLRFG